jgi:hypothetical protein
MNGLVSVVCEDKGLNYHYLFDNRGQRESFTTQLPYGFTDKEMDFIINYDIKYRMGRDGFEKEDE